MLASETGREPLDFSLPHELFRRQVGGDAAELSGFGLGMKMDRENRVSPHDANGDSLLRQVCNIDGPMEVVKADRRALAS
jgi:hypothetical protein